MKQTAVEWLLEQIFKHNNLVKGDGWFYVKPDIIEQAKEMEKEQIKDAWINSLTKGDYNSADEYYNETFKQQENETDSI